MKNYFRLKNDTRRVKKKKLFRIRNRENKINNKN